MIPMPVGRDGKIRRLLGVPAIAGVVASGLSACANSNEEEGGDLPPVSAMQMSLIEAILADSPSAFEKEVFADYRVSSAEYAEAFEFYRACLYDRGLLIVKDGRGSDISPLPEGLLAHLWWDDHAMFAAMEEAVAYCERGTYRYVGMVYWDQRDNPEGLSALESIRACFARRRVPDGAGLSDQLFSELVFGDDFSPESIEARMCLADPHDLNNWTVQEFAQQERLWSSGKSVPTPDDVWLD
jgi:hypothetical protein